MNDQKIGYQARILPPQPSHGLIIPDFSSEFSTRRSPPLSGPHNQGLYFQHNHASMDESQSNHSLSSTIISRFDSPTSAFFAAERCMGFPHYDSFGNLSSDPSFDFTNSSQPQSLPNPNDNAPSMFQHDLQTQFSINSKHNQDIRGYCGSFGSTISQLSFGSCDDHHNQGKQSSRVSSVNCGSISGNNSNNSSASAGTSKTRIRWNQDLHEKFVECVNRLGGAEKATPKAILKLMDSEGLTIFHVKSHLQKYRIAKYLPDSSEGKSEKRACLDVTTQLEATAGWQIKEALQLQLDVQRRLHEQLEIQRKLQLQIEEQGKQLKKMFDMQQKTSNSLFNTQSSDISSLDEDPLNSIDETQVFPSKIS